MRLHRLIAILLLIESKGTVKARELASKLEVSIRTVYRDIDILCEAGIPLTTTSGPNGGIHLMEGYSVGVSDLQKEDIINLYLGGIGILPDKQSDMAIKINNTLLKLQKNLPFEQSENLKDIKRRFYFDNTPWWNDSQPLQNIDILMEAIFKYRVLKITYQKYQGELSERKVYPYGIVVKRMDWYMIAYCEKSKEIRTFKCNRIIDAEVYNENFDIPESFSIEDYWNKSQNDFKNLCTEQEKYPVVLKLDKNNVNFLNNYETYNRKEDGSYLVVTVNMYGHENAVDSIMSMIRYVQVISPIELRASIEAELDSIISKYKNLSVK